MPAPTAPIRTPTPLAPVSHRTAAAILGTMVLLIVALTAILLETSRLDIAGSAPTAPPAPAETAAIAGR